MSSTIYDDCFIVMSEYGIQRMTKRIGQLNRGEVAVRIRLVMPNSAFSEPAISAVVNVPESAIIQPSVEVEALDAPEDVRPSIADRLISLGDQRRTILSRQKDVGQ